jgi:hypothetical protein
MVEGQKVRSVHFIKDHDLMAYGEVEVYFHLGTNGNKWSASQDGRFIPRERSPQGTEPQFFCVPSRSLVATPT